MINCMRVAFNLPGGIPIYTYSLLLGLGAALGLAWVTRQATPKEGHATLDAGMWVLAGALLGGRFTFVALHWNYFQAHPIEIPQVYLGGMDWGGASMGAFLILSIVAILTHTPVGGLADNLLPLLACLTVSVWLGCWIDGTAYGHITSTWWGIPSRDEWGQMALRFPVQFLGALLAVGLFWFVDWSRPWITRPGQVTGLAVFGLALEVIGLSFLRADPVPMWHGMALGSWTALGFALLAGSLIAISSIWFSTSNKGSDTEDETDISLGSNQHPSG
jgi:phosphatidylglycerol:prolipoprotein diacylglycerol transferase